MVGEPGSNAIIVKDGGLRRRTPRSRARAGATRCARAPRWRQDSTGRSGSRHAWAARCSFRSGPATASARRRPPPRRRRRRVPAAELREYPVDHVDVYVGPVQEQTLADQLDFLRRVFDPQLHQGLAEMAPRGLDAD